MSADTSISCTQPTRPFCKPLTHNELQNPGVGRHHTNLHSADIHLRTQQTTTTHISIHSYTHIPIYPYTHTPQTPNKHETNTKQTPKKHQTPTPPTNSPSPLPKPSKDYYICKDVVTGSYNKGPTTKDQQQGPPTTTRQQQQPDNNNPTTTKPPTVIPDLIGEANMETTKQP